ncbi:hypothetical protein BYT27DRAFT_7342549 [Phlegmacium glaucopus]|nr:hypothetical protein BYT27DRAFT_7342549 [Phlegmacium glaucopus]
MGQRHQAYLIARITPHGQPLGETRYRCIAALHHQDCWGRLPLRATTRFMTLIKQKENAKIIREEIHSIHGLYGTFGTPPKLPAVPCPFAHFLVHSAWSSNLNYPDEFPASGSRMIPASRCTRRGDNNDGITIIDVTDPESPAYCFVSIHGLDCEDTSNLPTMTPLSATQYLRAYYPEHTSVMHGNENQREQFVLATLRPFESLPMITIDMLAEAWPGEYRPDEPNISGLSPKPKESSATSVHMLPSLVDMTFVPALIRALETGETDRLDPLMWLPGNESKVKEILRVRNPMSAIDFGLLSKVIAVEVKQTKSIDLSHFSLTGEQVIGLVSAQESVEVLDLSHMQAITTDILRELVPTLPNLRRLVLLHTIPDADILSLLSESPKLFYRIESLIHLAFLRPLAQTAFPPVFSHIFSKLYRVSIASLPYFTLDQLVQGLTDFLLLFTTEDSYHDYEIPLLTAYASEVRGPGRSWSERIVPFIPGGIHTPNKPEGWFLAWSVPSPSEESTHHYAFAKPNKEVMEAYHRRIDELRSFRSNPEKPQNSEGQATGESELENFLEMLARERAIKSEYADRGFHIFDVKSFFQELVKEGRTVSSPEALTKLLETFAILKIDRHKTLRIMTQADLTSFLHDVTDRIPNYQY